MGIKDKLKNKEKNSIKKTGLKAAMSVVASVLSTNMLPIIMIAVVGAIAASILDMVVEIFTGENNPKLVYESLEIEDVAELVTIKGDEDNGYYLDFIDNIDDKLDNVIKQLNKSGEYHNLPDDNEFLKRMIKAEIVTQFPDLGGKIPDDSKDGFQGAINIRRVTPNKNPRRIKEYRKRRNINSRGK